MICNILKQFFRGNKHLANSRPRSPKKPGLEELESRLTPSTLATATNASVQIVPNLSSLSVTETVTVTVSNAPTLNPITGIVTPPPSGAANPHGMVLFNLNNQQQQAQLDSNGQATVSFQLPLLMLFTSQELTVQYNGAFAFPPLTNSYAESAFNAPLYLNFDNLLFPATVTFNPLAQTAGTSGLTPYNTAQGEIDSLGGLVFFYSDPGIITSFQVLGQTFPASLAASVGAYGPDFMSS